MLPLRFLLPHAPDEWHQPDRARNDTFDLRKELASLRLDDEPRRPRRGAWAVISLLVLMVAAGAIFRWSRGVVGGGGGRDDDAASREIRRRAAGRRC
jgi:ferric-dicitrate binding protein FerR (iron transport regulator)